MRQLSNCIFESLEYGRLEMDPKKKKRLLELDEEYGKLFMMYRNDWNTKDVKNLDKEFDKFMKARDKGEKYFPKLKLIGENGFRTDGIVERLERLRDEFMNFRCFLSKYYIELIDDMLLTVKFSFDPKKYYIMYTQYRGQRPTYREYHDAMKMLKKNQYEEIDVEKDRKIDAKTAAEEIQKYIDEKHYGWKVELAKDMLPRMGVGIDKILRVNKKAMFSKVDIESLKKHEVDGHVARRYYGYQTGLWLFVIGLKWRNILDEGLAIYNSLYHLDEPKPNVKFHIALKTIIAYHLCEKDFCELFDMCKELSPDLPDKSIFSTLCRFKKEIQDCSLLGGNGDDRSYFCGYRMVKAMTDDERDDILKYNVGPDQIKDIPKIKEFIRVNKLKPIK